MHAMRDFVHFMHVCGSFQDSNNSNTNNNNSNVPQISHYSSGVGSLETIGY